MDRFTLLEHEVVFASADIGPSKVTLDSAGALTVAHGFLLPSVLGLLSHH